MAAPRRERDESRVFKRMGEGLDRATKKVEEFAFRNDMYDSLEKMGSDKSGINSNPSVAVSGPAYKKGK